MLVFMDYVQNAFYSVSNWNRDNSYGTLTATARALLDFDTPNSIRLSVSSLSSPNYATSYTLGSTGFVDGSLSYLYSSLPLSLPSSSSTIPLKDIIEGYRQLLPLRRPDEPWWWEVWQGGKRVDRKDTLLYGRLYLPASTLEASYLRRLSPTSQLKLSCVSDSRLPNGGSILALLQHDVGKYSTEYLYSTDSALLGVRGLYNFGPDPRDDTPLTPLQAEIQQETQRTVDESILAPPQSIAAAAASAATLPSPTLPSRLSLGFEVYYGLLNRAGGASTGLRFTTLPSHTGFPYTMTLTLNPLMGNLSSTYAVKASSSLALCSQFDFNVYSYESRMILGMELWRRKQQQPRRRRSRRRMDGQENGGGDAKWPENERRIVNRSNNTTAAETDQQTQTQNQNPEDEEYENDTNPNPNSNTNTSGVLKALINEQGSISLLWEGKIKDLLFTTGVVLDMNMSSTSTSMRNEGVFKSLGFEVAYSS